MEKLLQQQVEAIIFASEEVVTFRTINSALGLQLNAREMHAIVEQLNAEYAATARSFQIYSLAGGYRFLARPEFGALLQQLVAPKVQRKFSRSLLEVLAVVAYHQPVTRAAIQEIRGVSPDYAIDRLLERGYIEVRGRADSPGKPLQYGTTTEFLDLFHLSSIKDLPKLREIKEILQEQEEQDYLAGNIWAGTLDNYQNTRETEHDKQ